MLCVLTSINYSCCYKSHKSYGKWQNPEIHFQDVWMCKLETNFGKIIQLLSLTHWFVISPLLLWDLFLPDLSAILWQSFASVTRGKGLKRCTCRSNGLIIACGGGRLVRIAPLPPLPAGREVWGLCSLRLNDSQSPTEPAATSHRSRFTDSLSAHDKWQNHPEPPPPH